MGLEVALFPNLQRSQLSLRALWEKGKPPIDFNGLYTENKFCYASYSVHTNAALDWKKMLSFKAQEKRHPKYIIFFNSTDLKLHSVSNKSEVKEEESDSEKIYLNLLVITRSKPISYPGLQLMFTWKTALPKEQQPSHHHWTFVTWTKSTVLTFSTIYIYIFF